MNKTAFLFAALLIFAAGCISGSTGDVQKKQTQADLEKDYLSAAVLVQCMEILEKQYVDGDRIPRKQLFENAIRGMVSSLDPYSGYEPPRTYTEQQKKRLGELCGIGVVIAKPPQNYLHVVDVIPDSPADKAGIRPGSAILAIDGKDLKKFNLYQCQKLLQGTNGSRVILTLLAGKKISKTALIRRKVITPSVAASKLIEGHIGYIRLISFTPHTPNEFRKALAKLKKQKADAFIIDLRGNTGGQVRAAVLTLSQLLEPGKVLMKAYQRTRKEEIVRSVKLRNIQPDTKSPVALIVNNFTASSAEIFSGALKDNNRAEIVGARTFGKGTLLHVVRLADGGALRFASGRYLTPSGAVIEGKGLEPDHKVLLPLLQTHRLTMQMRRFPGEVKPAVKNAVKDTQLEFAIQTLEKIDDEDIVSDESDL